MSGPFFATKPTTRLLWAVTLLILLGLTPAVGQAAVILGNLGATRGGNQSIGPTQWYAASFTMGSTPYKLSDVQVTLGNNPVAGTTFLLETDASGHPSGTVVSTLPTNTPAFGSGTTTYTFSPGSPITLAAGTKYWLVGHTPTGGGNTAWNNSSSNPAGSGATFSGFASSGNSGSAWTTATNSVLFQIDGVAVPEPSSLILVGTVACVGAAAGWRRRRKSRLDEPGVTAQSADGT
jgi:hypothetical protein